MINRRAFRVGDGIQIGAVGLKRASRYRNEGAGRAFVRVPQFSSLMFAALISFVYLADSCLM